MEYLKQFNRLWRAYPFPVAWAVNTLTFVVVLLVMSHCENNHGVSVRKAEAPRVSSPVDALKWRPK